MSTSFFLRVGTITLAFLAVSGLAQAEQPNGPDPAKVAFFEKKIRPMLVNHCFICHSADTNSKGGLRVDDLNGLLRGGATGPAIVPGQPEKSNLLKRVTLKDEKKRMPIEGTHLTEEQVADLTTS